MEVVIFGMLAAAAAAYSWRANDKAWTAVAEDVGLDYTNPLLGRKKLAGRRRGFDVEVYPSPNNDRGTELLIEVSGVDPGFTLGQDSAFLRMVKPDIETGDHVFDQRTRIEGNPDWALALLGDEARRLAEIVISGWNGKLKGNALTASFKNISHTASTLDTILDLAQLLRRPPARELPTLLGERARHDPSTPVRLQAFRQLTASPALRQEALATAEALLDSPARILKLEACRLLITSSSEKSDLAAEELTTLATGQWDETSVRRSALEALVESRHRRSAIPAMQTILGQPNAPTTVRTAALEGLIAARATTELLAIRTQDATESEILARGLGRFDTSVQPRLLQLLEGSGDRVRVAAVKSLGRVGDLDAILALRRIADQGGLFKSSVAREAEHAISEIKSRADGSQQGEISIIDVAPLEGAISPSDDSEPGGEVSLTS